ncbi:fungal-specific transcription factor domain-containing protein [Phaeosphaeriaceae sp. PMI808]|nr:fungal-specific transcription factor domain-containing protein [Phaeosphaeriaceae sp. PMI808]
MSDESPQTDNSPGAVQYADKNGGRPSNGGGLTLNLRSCVTCRRRKVKCDKKQPCSNCVRSKIECSFPGPGRAPRRTKKPQDAELLERLRRLEGVVSSLNAQVEEHEQEAAAEREHHSSTSDSACPYGNGNTKSNASPGNTNHVAIDTTVEGLESRFGRLVIEKGRSRYINNSFWASLNNEVEDLKTILVESSDDEEETAHSPESPPSNSSQHHAFIFGYSSTSVNMAALHPSEQHAHLLWQAFKTNVDPLIKVLHIPTFEPIFFKAVANPSKVSKGLEALLFAIYYGSVTSTLPDECCETWGEDRVTLLGRYRFGIEQALARANFLYCNEVIIFQAFMIFLILLRRNDDARKIWTLTGVAVRIAQTLGIHRDGTHFKLPPFQVEMRRRLWWQVCILDARSSEDHGCDPTIVEAQFDTKMPLNVNDTDLDPDMVEFPKERKGFTEMSFCLLRFEVSNIFRRISYIPPGPVKCNEFFTTLTIAEKEKWITECHARMEEKYLRDMDMSIPLCWVAATISRLIMSKMWLIVYHPYQRKDGGTTLPQETKDKLFITSLENIEYSILLETEARTMKWGWLFRTYVQWHAIAFLLSELCVRTKGEAVERAWRALEVTVGRWWFPLNDSSPDRKGQHGCLWQPLRRLLVKAKAAREKELTLERASIAVRTGQMTCSRVPQDMEQLQTPPISVDQLSPESLDQMLRRSAPRLGESPFPSVSSWPSSTSLPKGQLSLPAGPVQKSPNMQHQRTTSTGAFVNQGSAGQDFSDLADLGLDSVLLDVLDGARLDGGTDFDFSSLMSPTATTTLLASPQPTHVPNPALATSTNMTNNLTSAVNGTNGTSSNAMFPDTNFNGIPLASADGGNNLLDDGNMDWTVWDDMVSELEGQLATQNPNGNPASNYGFMEFF